MLIRDDEPVILTFSGRYVQPLNLRHEDVCIEDIAHALSNQARFSGHTSEFYSVGQHSVHTYTVTYTIVGDDRHGLSALLHDATETYLQDCARPLKEHPDFQAYREAEQRAEKVIAEVFNIPYPHPPCVKEADTILLASERRDLMPPNGQWEVTQSVEPVVWTIRPWTPKRAKETFLFCYHHITRTKKVA